MGACDGLTERLFLVAALALFRAPRAGVRELLVRREAPARCR